MLLSPDCVFGQEQTRMAPRIGAAGIVSLHFDGRLEETDPFPAFRIAEGDSLCDSEGSGATLCESSRETDALAEGAFMGPPVGIPMMSISHSDLMPIRAERSDAGLSQ